MIAVGDVTSVMRLADDAALTSALASAAPCPAVGHVAAAGAPYRRPDGSYRFENRLRYWIIGT